MIGAILSAILGLGLGLMDCEEVAGEPRSIVVVVANAEVAETVRQEMPRVRIVVLQVELDEPAEVIESRAWDYRTADCFFFDPDSDSLDLAILRERMKNHGVVPIDMRKHFLASNSLLRGNREQMKNLKDSHGFAKK
ncbi:MAG: hypothetical protein Q8M16_17080 [Pirellulaceae bacterium]|nr:hypothetical protein [Pirellulaceae bacterium]